MERSRKTSGISLVALVVTIIVLIILTGAVIATFMEGGIIDRAKESVFKNDIRSYQEMLVVKNAEIEIQIQTGDGTVTRLEGPTLDKIKGIIPEFKDDYEDIVAISEGELVLGARMLKEKEDMTDDEINYKEWLLELGIGIVATEGGNEVVYEEVDESLFEISTNYYSDPAIRVKDGVKITQENIVIPTELNGVEVKYIDYEGFSGQTNIKRVKIPAGIDMAQGSEFQGCTSLEEVIWEGSISGIGPSAFNGCSSLKNITIPEGVKNVASFAFQGTALTSITIPSSVNWIGAGAFLPSTDEDFAFTVNYGGTMNNFKSALEEEAYYFTEENCPNMSIVTINCSDGSMTLAEAVQ